MAVINTSVMIGTECSHDVNFIDLLTFASPNPDIPEVVQRALITGQRKVENFTPPWSQGLRASSFF